MTIPLLPGDPHDEDLRHHVHPAAWVNPTPAPRYHLVVLGAGTAGLVSAAGAAGLGARVALLERDLMGGDCLTVGCVPSKAVLRAARAVAEVRRSPSFGVRLPGEPAVDFPAVMERMRQLRARLSPHDSAERFRKLGVDVFLGQGVFTGPDSVAVGGQTLKFRKAVIATGSRAAIPDVPGLEAVGFLTNENVFNLTTLPSRLAVLGGGPIGCELAQAFASFGSRVTLFDRNDRLLGRDDAEAARRVKVALRRDGVEILFGTTLRRAEKRDGAKVLTLAGPAGERELVVDEILVGAGRQPNVEGLGLEVAGVRYDPRNGVEVDDYLRTSNPRIYAAGDVCSRYQFTHAADAMARIVVQNALFWGWAKASALTIPWCTYISPELAQVGLTEAEARLRGVPVDVFVQEMDDVDRAVLDGADEGFVKVLVRRGSDRIVGATVLASHAGDLIAVVSAARAGGVGLKKLARTVFPYPTQAEAFRKVADAYNRTRLKPWVRWVLGRWLRWTT